MATMVMGAVAVLQVVEDSECKAMEESQDRRNSVTCVDNVIMTPRTVCIWEP
jgi:hypothetical protein